MNKMLGKLKILYGEGKGKKIESQLVELIKAAKSKITSQRESSWSEKDLFLITYPDSFYEKNIPTLRTLNQFLQLHLQGVINGVHILPFYPYSSDRGFAITDFYQVKSEFGNWQDLEEIGKNYHLMADLVLNHVSVKHEWFQKFFSGY